jgi:DNA-binding NarL/FixJ family response regulator
MGDHRLEVSFVPCAERAQRTWQLLFEVRFDPRWVQKLTAREREVLLLVCQGWDNQYIAQELRCSVGTVKKHVSAILRCAGMDRSMLAASHYSA